MDAFRWVAVSLSMVLGLGVTRILTGSVAVFRSRHHAKIHWLPLAWAASIFVLQIQFWWAVIELAALVQTWTLVGFLLLLTIPLVLFVAAAMVLPASELEADDSLLLLFRRDGRWGLLCLTAYAILAIAVNYLLFGVWDWSGPELFVIAELVLPLAFLMSPSARLRAAITIAYLLLVLWSSWVLSPKAYGP